MKILLTIHSDTLTEPKTYPLEEGVFRVGRSDFCDIVLEGKEISRSHLEIRVTPNSVYVTNMSTTGHMRLNGERVETCELKEQDTLKISNYDIRFSLADEPVQEPDLGNFSESDSAEPLEAPLSDGPENLDVVQSPLSHHYREFPVQEIQEGNLAVKTENTDLEGQAIVAKIMFTEGPLAGTEIPIQGYEMSLGRSRKADIFIPDDKLSRKHAKITRIGAGYRLIDLESRNGTYVNGVRVLEHPLSSFDLIEIGRSKMKFLILDLHMGGFEKGKGLQVIEGGAQTKSLQLNVDSPAVGISQNVDSAIQKEADSQKPSNVLKGNKSDNKKRKNLIFGALLVVSVLGYLLIPSKTEEASIPEKSKSESISEGGISKNGSNEELLPSVPREFSELSPENQRKVEGHYNTALRYQERDSFMEALKEIKELHLVLPYYKESKRLERFFENKVLERQRSEASERAKRDREAEIRIYLEEGIEYLGQSNFSRAGEAFRNVLLLDPQNNTASKGVKAAEMQINDISNLPPEIDPELEKKKLVAQLLERAQIKYEEKSYQEAINFAEQVRAIEIKGETEYLNEAKQIIDRSRILQKEEFEPFLIQAKEKFAEGDYNLSRDLCDEMLKRDPSYEAAQECSIRARKQLNRLAKEAYTHGYILESMNRIEEAKQYWNRAKNYARPGDPYFEKIQRKLDNYQ